MITIELLNSNKANDGMAEVEIYCDEAGLHDLKKQIDFLIMGQSHVHLMTPAWAGTELSEKPVGKGALVHHLRVTKIAGGHRD